MSSDGIQIIKPDRITKNVWAIRVEMPKYIDNHIIKYIPMPKTSDRWYAEIFIEDREKE